MQVLIPLAILFLLFWLFVVMPQRRRQREHVAMQDSVAVGDEVITAGGLHGDVVELEDGVVALEIAAGVVVRVDRRAIAGRVEHEPHGDVETPPEPAETGSATDANPG